MFAITLYAAVGLVLGLVTAIRAHRAHGWVRATARGLAATLAAVTLCLVSLLLITAFAAAGAAICVLGALALYDKGRLWAATVLVGLAALCVAVSGGLPR